MKTNLFVDILGVSIPASVEYEYQEADYGITEYVNITNIDIDIRQISCTDMMCIENLLIEKLKGELET